MAFDIAASLTGEQSLAKNTRVASTRHEMRLLACLPLV